jgi:hypothetical protein
MTDRNDRGCPSALSPTQAGDVQIGPILAIPAVLIARKANRKPHSLALEPNSNFFRIRTTAFEPSHRRRALAFPIKACFCAAVEATRALFNFDLGQCALAEKTNSLGMGLSFATIFLPAHSRPATQAT